MTKLQREVLVVWILVTTNKKLMKTATIDDILALLTSWNLDADPARKALFVELIKQAITTIPQTFIDARTTFQTQGRNASLESAGTDWGTEGDHPTFDELQSQFNLP